MNDMIRTRSLTGLAWRNLRATAVRSGLSAAAVAIAVSIAIASNQLGRSVLEGFADSRDVQTIAAGLWGQFDTIVSFVGLLVSGAAAFMVLNAFMMSVTQRRHQIGSLRALGMTRGQVLRVLLIEALFIAGVGALIGVVAGPLLGEGLIAFLQAIGGDIFNSFADVPLNIQRIALAVAMGFGTTLLAILIPAWQAAQLSPLVAMRREIIEADRTRAGRGPVLGGVLAAVIVAWIVIAPPARNASAPADTYMLLAFGAMWVLAVALLLPGVVGLVARRVRGPLERRWGAVGRLTADNLSRGRGRVTLTVAALALGLGLIITTSGGMNFAFFELLGRTFTAAAEREAIAVFPFDMEAGASGFASLDTIAIDTDIKADMEDELGDAATLSFWYFTIVPELSFPAMPDYFSYVLDTDSLRAIGSGVFEFSEGDWEHAYPIMKDGCGVLVTPLVANTNNAALYDTVIVTGADGPLECTIAGIGQPMANASMISLAAAPHLDVGSPMTLMVAPTGEMPRDELIARVESVTARYPGHNFIPMDEYLGLINSATDSMVAALNGILLLAVVAAGLGVVNTTMMAVTERRAEFGLLRSVGATRRQVIAVVAGEAALMGVIGAAVGIIAGAGLVVILVTVYGGNSWGVPDLDLWPAVGRSLSPTIPLVVVGLLSAPIISALAAVLPARGILRGTAIDTMDPRRTPQPEQRPQSIALRSFNRLATRSLLSGQARAVLGALSVAAGVAVTIAADVMTGGILSAMGEGSVMADFVGAISVFISATGLIVSAAAGFLVYNSLTMSVAQRQQEIGSLRALGATRRQVMRLIVLEAGVIGVSGTLLGLLIGPAVGQALLTVIEQTGLEPGNVSPSPVMMIIAAVFGIGISLLAGWLPARKASRIPPIIAVRQAQATSEDAALKPARLWLGGGLALALTALFVFLPPYHLMGQSLPNPLFMWVTLFGLWGLTVLIFGLLLPGLVRGLLALLRGPARRFGVVGRLASDNLSRAPGRVTIMALAFAIGIGIVLWTGGQVDFVNSAVTFNADRYLAEQSWIASAINPDDALAQLNSMGTDRFYFEDEEIAAVEEAVDGLAQVSLAYQVIVPEISAPVPGFPSAVVNPAYLQAPGGYTFTAGSWETAGPILESGCGLLISANTAGRHSAGLGDPVTVTGLDGPVTCRVAGIGNGGTLPISFVGITARDQFIPSDQRPDTLNIRPLPDADRDAIDAALTSVEERYPGDVYIYQAEDAIAGVLETSDQLTGSFALLQVLAVIAAALGVANTTLQSILERQREIGLLRAVGATRQQVRRTILSEAFLTGIIGALLGLLLGTAMTLVYGFTVGGTGIGVDGLPVTTTTLGAALSSLRYGAAGLVLSPLLAVAAAAFPVRSILRGTAIETIQPERRPTVSARERAGGLLRWGSLRVRFALGTALLMAAVLFGLTTVVTGHARSRLEEQVAEMIRAMVTLNSAMLETNLPDDAQTLTLDDLQGGGAFDMDPDALLRFESLLEDITENGVQSLVVTDRNGVVLISLDERDLGTSLTDFNTLDPDRVLIERDRESYTMQAVSFVRNENDEAVGAVRLTVNMEELADFLDRLRTALWAAGAVMVLIGVVAAWALATPLSRTTTRLAGHAQRAGDGDLDPYAGRQPRGMARRFSIRVRLTAALVLILALTVGLLQLITLPMERNRLESTIERGVLTAAEWMSDAVSETLGQDPDAFAVDDIDNLTDLMSALSSVDFEDAARMQEISDEMRLSDMAYMALVDTDGQVVASDQLALIGESAPAPVEASVERTTWRGDDVLVATAPLRRGQGGEQVGALRIALRTSSLEDFLSESRTIFRLSGLIALLAGVLLAQVIGTAVSEPARRLAADVRRVGQGDFTVRFDDSGGDELALLASAYNDMVAGLQEREWLRDMFGRFVSREVADALRSGQVQLSGENRVVSVLFTDIRDFTALSEDYPPAEIVSLLNAYLPLVVEAAGQHGGTVNKFGGDSTLIIYGAPDQLADSAYHAVRTALTIRHNLDALNEQLEVRGYPPIRIGVGINTGEVIAGAVGPTERQEYTVIGDTVNLASRIEALNKQFPDHEILISEWTLEALGSRHSEFAIVDLGSIDVRGKADPVRVYAVDSWDGA